MTLNVSLFTRDIADILLTETQWMDWSTKIETLLEKHWWELLVQYLHSTADSIADLWFLAFWSSTWKRILDKDTPFLSMDWSKKHQDIDFSAHSILQEHAYIIPCTALAGPRTAKCSCILQEGIQVIIYQLLRDTPCRKPYNRLKERPCGYDTTRLQISNFFFNYNSPLLNADFVLTFYFILCEYL